MLGTSTAAPFVLSSAAAEELTDGRWFGLTHDVTLHGAAIDSRAVTKAALFACIVGERVDGHDFAAAAVTAGAALILASRPLELSVPVLVVADVTVALGALAAEFRRRLTTVRWLGITGSNGKTTVKELCAAACVSAGRVHATAGNLNNHLGVPLTVLATPADTAVAVVEMGANHQREIAGLAAIAQPHIGIITAIGPAHLEGFGGLAGVATGKAELFSALPEDGVAIFGRHGLAENAAAQGVSADALLSIIRSAAGARTLSEVGDDSFNGSVDADGITLTHGDRSVRLALLGAHNLANAQVALQAALALGIDADAALDGLARVRPVGGRLETLRLGEHTLIDDSYNANPASMVAGLRVLAARDGRRLAVLGAMGELGDGRVGGHRRVGEEAARLSLPLIAVGAGATELFAAYRAHGGPDGSLVPDIAAAIEETKRRLRAGATTVLVKASRSAGLDALVRGLMTEQPGGAPC